MSSEVTSPPRVGLRRPADFGPPGDWVARNGLPAGGALLVSGGAAAPHARRDVLGLHPVETLVWHAGDAGSPFAALTALQARGRRSTPGAALDPVVVCALAYDLGRTVERLPALAAAETKLPDLWAARYAAAYVWDRLDGRGEIVADSAEAADALAAALSTGRPRPRPMAVAPPVPELGPEAHHAALARVQTHIRAGDTYQINFTVRFRAARTPGADPIAFHPHLQAASPAAFGACLRLDPDRAVFSISPERFLAWDAAGNVETWPIKGTRPRGATPAGDAAEIAALLESAKDAAEHVMIVDLQRNDLGRVCEIGSVTVPRLRTVETHPTLHHLVSTVRGRLRPDVDLEALLRATFPGGSITGAPKIRSMEIIEALEPVRRGLYCGAIGHLDADGGGDLNIAIRTAWTDAEAIYYQAGGGIVADSDPAAEWAELMTKTRAFQRACAAANAQYLDFSAFQVPPASSSSS